MGKHKKWVQLVIFGVVLVIGVFTIVSNLTSSGPAKYPQPGGKAPDFTLIGLDGKKHKLSEFKGKPVMLNFWGTFCPPCKEEMPAIQRQYDKWSQQGVVFLGVNLDQSPITVQAFMEQFKLNLPTLLDPKEEVRKLYGVSEYPTTFFIQADGTVKAKHIGEMKEAFIEQSLDELTAAK